MKVGTGVQAQAGVRLAESLAASEGDVVVIGKLFVKDSVRGAENVAVDKKIVANGQISSGDKISAKGGFLTPSTITAKDVIKSEKELRSEGVLTVAGAATVGGSLSIALATNAAGLINAEK